MTTPTPGDNEVKENNVNNLSARLLAAVNACEANKMPGTAKLLREAAAALSALPAAGGECTCPSGDGSLRWPCPRHPPTPQPSAAEGETNGFITTVPDKSDRIIWRGHYYHLPRANNRLLEPVECANACPPQTVCDYCQRGDGTAAAVGAQGDELRAALEQIAAETSARDATEAADRFQRIAREALTAAPAAGKGVDDAMVERFCAAFFTPKWPTSSTHNDNVLRDMVRAAIEAALTRQPVAGDGQHHKLDTDRQVFFYEQDFYVLSNFSAFTLEWKGRRFDTSEAAYHWEKFPDAPEVQDMLLEAPSAHAAFKLAESQKVFRRPDWDDVKLNIMRDILRAKATQHEYVRRKLLATGTRELVEDSWRDDYWGWGPNRDGRNWLGRLWMEVRAELAAAPAATPTDGGEGS